MNKQSIRIITAVVAMAALIACNADFSSADTSLNGTWIAVNGTELKLEGMSYTKTTALGAVETGTFSASDGLITFSRPGLTSDTQTYERNFPQLVIGSVTYYHDSPSEPIDIEGMWFSATPYNIGVVFGPGTRIKDENKKETLDLEGEYRLYMKSKGRYIISSRNLPGNDKLITIPTHISGCTIFTFINMMMPINLLSLFDQSNLVPPDTQEGVEEWWYTLEEAKKFFEEAASRAEDLDTRVYIYYYSAIFFADDGEISYYNCMLEHDPDYEYRFPEGAIKATPEDPYPLNKLTLQTPYETGGSTYSYVKYNGYDMEIPKDDPFYWASDDPRWDPNHPDYPGWQ